MNIRLEKLRIETIERFKAFAAMHVGGNRDHLWDDYVKVREAYIKMLAREEGRFYQPLKKQLDGRQYVN